MLYSEISKPFSADLENPVNPKTIRNFTVWLRWCSNSQDSHPSRCPRGCGDKKGTSRGLKMELWDKNRQKSGFFGVFRSTLRRFGISLNDSDDAQTHRIATEVYAQKITIIKKATLEEKKRVLSRKPSKEWVFWGIQVYTKTIRNFTVWLRWCSNSQDSHPIRCARGCANKKGTFTWLEMEFWDKNRQKSGFFGIFRSTLRRFGISLNDSDDAQTHRIATQVDAQKITILKKGNFRGKKKSFEPKTVKKVGFLGYSGLH